MKKYPVEQWHEMAMNGSNMLLVNYMLSPKDFEGWIFSHQLSDQPSAHAKNTAYFFKRSRNDNDEAMRIDITEADSITAAEQAFLDMLTNVMAPMEFPLVNDGPGVVCYKGFSDIDSILMFLRANIAVRVRSIGQKEITVLNEAKKIDAEISSEPGNDDSKTAPKTNIDFSAAADEVMRQIAANSTDATGKKVYYKIMAPDHKTELTRNGMVARDNAIPSNIVLYVVGEDGAVLRVPLK